MKTQTKKIEVPEGFKIDKFNQQTGEYTLVEHIPTITERIKSVDDAIKLLGAKDPEVILYEALLLSPIDKDSHVFNYQLVVLLTKALNEGWQPDWNNNRQYKYYPYFEMGGSGGFRCNDYGGWYSVSFVGSRLCFKSSDLAEHAGKTFTAIYKKYMLIS